MILDSPLLHSLNYQQMTQHYVQQINGNHLSFVHETDLAMLKKPVAASLNFGLPSQYFGSKENHAYLYLCLYNPGIANSKESISSLEEWIKHEGEIKYSQEEVVAYFSQEESKLTLEFLEYQYLMEKENPQLKNEDLPLEKFLQESQKVIQNSILKKIV